MSKSFVRHGSTKVPVYGRVYVYCVMWYQIPFWEKLPCQNMSEKSGKKLVRAEILTNADRCGIPQRADFVNGNFFNKKKWD